MKPYISIYEEKQVGILYHFTQINWLEDIIKSNYVLKSSTRIKINGERKPIVSFTRQYDLPREAVYVSNSNVRITVNGDKLSNKYKIQPRADFTSSDGYKKEKEEAVFGDKIDIKNFIIQIDILYDEEKFADFYNDKYQLIQQQNIIINFVEKWKPIK